MSKPPKNPVYIDPKTGIHASLNNKLTPAGPLSVTLNGVASSSAGIASVELLDYTYDDGIVTLGRAAVAADGSWTFTDTLPEPGIQNVGLRVTDTLGHTWVPPMFGFRLEADSPRPGEIEEDINKSDYGYTQGNVYDAQRLLYTEVDNFRNGHPTVATGYGGGKVPFTIFDNSSMAAEVITNFHVSGPRHDTLNLEFFRLGNLVMALQHTSDVDGSAVIHNDAGHTLTLEGVTKQELMHNRRDFLFP